MGTFQKGTVLSTKILFFCAFFLSLYIATSSYALRLNQRPTDVILIGWDGAQLNHVKECLKRGELPNLKKLSSEGSFVSIEVTGHQTQTEPGFAQILTGYKSETSGIRANGDCKVIPEGYTIFERLENHFGHDKFVTVALINKDSRLNCTADNSPYYNAALAANVFRNGLGDDQKVADEAVTLLREYKDKPFFFFLQFSAPDKNGHNFDENSQQYNDALIYCDKLLGEVIRELKSLNIYDRIIVYVTSDHGFTENATGHGYAPYVFMATNDHRKIRGGFQSDIAPTVLDRFGVDLKKVSPPLDGRPLTK